MAALGREGALQEISSCTQCEQCLEVCPTYLVSGELPLSPVGRLEAAARVLEGGEIDGRLAEALYTCTKCMACEQVCPQGVKVTEVVHEGRRQLVALGKAPFPNQKKIIDGILKNGNSVGGDPSARLAWLPEPLPRKESDTLLFLGCLPSYLVTEAARSSYLLLKKLGVDFMVLEDEGCCGIYPYEAGMTDLAYEIFSQKVEQFEKHGVKELIVPCNGCLKTFKYFYPRVLGGVPFRVRHLLEVVHERWKESGLQAKGSKEVSYQDPCRLSRGEGLYREPRELLGDWGFKLLEPSWTPQEAPCCGAGAGVRSLYRDLSLRMARRVLDGLPADTVVSTCPFCTFNLNYASRKGGRTKTVRYFTALLLEHLSS